MKNVGAIFVDEHTVVVVAVICVSTNVRAPINKEDFLVQSLG